MRKLRVENTLYDLSDEVWRQVNDLLSKAESTRPITQEMLKDGIPLDQSKTAEAGDSPPEDSPVPAVESSDSGVDSSEDPTPLGEDLADENKP